MSFATNILGQPRPDSIRRNVMLPRRRAEYFPSPLDWRDEVLYFLLVDRFSDGQEAGRPLLDHSRIDDARQRPGGVAWRWDEWAESGALRWQGGTLRGVQSKLGYLRDLGITAIWLSPVFKQRVELDTFHGYGVQDFLDVDPRVGTRDDLVELVGAAHDNGIRLFSTSSSTTPARTGYIPATSASLPLDIFPTTTRSAGGLTRQSSRRTQLPAATMVSGRPSYRTGSDIREQAAVVLAPATSRTSGQSTNARTSSRCGTCGWTFRSCFRTSPSYTSIG